MRAREGDWPSLTELPPSDAPLPFADAQTGLPGHHPQSLEETPSASKPPCNGCRPNSHRDLTQKPMQQFKSLALQNPDKLRRPSACVHLGNHLED